MTPKHDGTIDMSDASADQLPSLPSRFSRMVPSGVTVVALCCGMTGIELAIMGMYQAAALALILAGVFDGLDGRAARMLKTTSTFGAELDSLSDLVSFGVAPAVLLYVWSLAQVPSIGWAFTVFFVVCCGLRLARFNTQLRGEIPSLSHHFFTGVPAPAGAGLALVPMFMNFASGNDVFRSPVLTAFVIALVGLLMVSRVPTLSLKRIGSAHITSTVAASVLIVVSLVVVPWTTLTLGGILYAATIPFGSIVYHRLQRSDAVAVQNLPHSSVVNGD
jgi:CDP-diacylglycerol---serine O-phosphatidyltransferase